MSVNFHIVLLVVIGIVISFVSAVEVAFFSASRLAIELRNKQDKYSGKVWAAYFQKPVRFISASILVLNLLLVFYVFSWWNILESVWDYWAVESIYLKIAGTAVISAFSLLVLEFVLRPVFHARSTSFLSSNFVTVMITVLFSLFHWIAGLLMDASRWVLKYIFNVKTGQDTEVFSRPDIDTFVRLLKHNEHGDTKEKNDEIFENILSLPEVKIKTCLVPRPEIMGVKDKVSVDELARVFNETKLSKLVVYDETIDNIKGYVHQLDMLKNPKSLQSILLPIPVVPESMNARDLIRKFSKERKSIAWVIDEFGGTAGIVTMEDLLEEIFGDINDEFDAKDDFVEKKVGTNEYLLSGRLSLDVLSEKYDLEFHRTEDVETLNGYIIKRSGGIPRQKDRIIIDNYQFDIISVAKTRVEAVKLKVLR